MVSKFKKIFSKSTFRKALLLLRKALIIWFAITFFWVLALRFINPPITWLMLQRGFERKADGKDWKIQKDWVKWDDLPRNMKLAAIGGEDARFLNHWGFDLQAIEKAYKKNQKGKRVRGGSTISQQTAKNVFLWPGRSWFRKGLEVYFTGLIELLWSKKRILEVYLNVIETGDGLYGTKAAAAEYFNKTPSDLSKGQCALIIAVLPNPRRWSPARPTGYIYYKQGLILRNMRRLRKANI